MHVAQTILQQLGGKRFALMTGAKDFVASPDALSFRLPRCPKNGANKCRITLTPADLYTVEFFTVRGTEFKHRGTREDIYADQLQDVFTDATGLHTRF